MNYKTEKRVEETKKKMRSDLKSSTEWTELNHFQNFDTSLSSIKPSSSIPRIHVNDVSLEEFVEKYERPYLPCVILGATDHWKAWEKWTPKKLAKKYRNQPFKCGEDDHGNSVKIKMKYYMEYMLRNQDDVPMYIFDASFGEHSSKKQLLEDYDIPKYFREDLFQHVGNRRRPPHRWFLCGPARSGSGIHIDPIGTSAWNSLIRGHKRWCLFPPETPAQLLKVTRVEGRKQKGEAITWFNIIYPRTQAPDWPKEFAPIEILQEPGETMFVPGGWWHVVLNLDVTIAVTQNFCSRANFPIVWNKLVHERPKLSQKFYTILNEQLPDVARIADSVDLAMQIGMQYDITGSSSSSSSNSSSGDDSEDDEDSDGHSTVTTVLTLNEDKNEKPRVFKFSYQKNAKNQPAQQSLD